MKFKINGVDWSVEKCSNSENPLADGLFCGKTFFFDRKIYLNKDLNQSGLEETIRHELVHAFLYQTQILNQEKDFSYSEEMLCEFVGKYGKDIEKIAERYLKECKGE